MIRVVTGLPYYGGKALLGKWINQFLPWKWDQIYVEPYGGMSGVLHHREPVKIEIINDLNDRIINWWFAIRDHTDELIRLIKLTPISRTGFNWAKRNLDNPRISPVRRALAYQIVVHQSLINGDGHPTWVLSFLKNDNKGWYNPETRMLALAERMQKVQLENRDAFEILDRTRRFEQALIYVDPPYPSADSGGYRKHLRDVDVDELTFQLLNQKGLVAISGYGDEWDHLGWTDLQKQHVFCGTHTVNHHNARAGVRVEKLWVNW